MKRIFITLFCAISIVVGACDQSAAEPKPSNENEYSKLAPSHALYNFAAGVKTIVERRIIYGAPLESIRFNTPEEFHMLSDPTASIFHRNGKGGGQTYVAPAAKYMANGKEGKWAFNAALHIPRVGTDGEGGGDLTAYLVGITHETCIELNRLYKDLPNSSIPVLHSEQSSYYSQNIITDGIEGHRISQATVPALDNPHLAGTAGGCFEEHTGGTYVYFYVIAPR